MSKTTMNRLVAATVAALGMTASWAKLPIEIVEGTIDYNADRKTDLVWYHPDGYTGIWLLDGLTITSANIIYGGPSSSRVVLTGDTGADGNSDFIWKRVDGSYWISIMSGYTVQETRQIYAQGDPAGTWDVVAKADFNGDHKMDLLWRRNSDGAYGAWLMDGVSIPAVSMVNPPAAGYSIAALGDFNGDGKTDVLWVNTDGRIAVSLTSTFVQGNMSFSSTTEIAPAGSTLTPVKVADFNGDGKTDILMSGSDGSQSIWLMNGGAVTTKGTLYQPGNKLVAEQVCDMNGDGKADIIWKDPTDLSYTVTLVNGTAITESTRFTIGGSSGWTLLGHGDYNGDGKADLIWRYTDASYGLWLMNGSQITTAAVLLHGGSGWEMEDVAR